MISVCIPVYNFDVTELVTQLYEQGKKLDTAVEILIIDDASDSNIKQINKGINDLVDKYVELDSNIGRSAIRNLFLSYSKYNNLVFLDCDGLLESKDFLRKYLNAISEEASVVVGGRVYGPKPENKSKLLRWSYGRFRESRSLVERLQHPYKSFMTNNFMIDKRVFKTIKFDESLTKYGHEDTLFGFELENTAIPISHINNPVLNIDLESAEEYLYKTKEGLNNLYNISSSFMHSEKFVNGIKLLRFWRKTRGLSTIITGIYAIFRKSIEANILGEKPNLKLFDFYKLNEIIQIDRAKRKSKKLKT